MTWPNVLVLSYLTATKKASPEIATIAKTHSTTGYQRLLTFECQSHGFNWWVGDDPGNQMLTAMAVMQFVDMLEVLDIDEAVITRSQNWLADKQQTDGSWEPGDSLHGYNVSLGADRLRTTAFVTWALATSGYGGDAAAKGAAFLTANLADAADAYSKGMLANALAAADPTSPTLAGLLAELIELAQVDDDGRVYWTSSSGSMTGSWGSKLTVETTALIAHAMLLAGGYSTTAKSAIEYLVSARGDSCGWGTTQATILALRTLVRAATKGMGGGVGTITATVDGAAGPQVEVTAENEELLQYMELQPLIGAGPNEVTLEFEGEGGPAYQLVSRHHVPWPEPESPDVLTLTVDLSDTSIALGSDETITVQAVLANVSPFDHDMVMAEIGLPPGFRVLPSALEAAKETGVIANFETGRAKLVVYAGTLPAGESLELEYEMKPTYAVEAQLPGSRAYLYYDPDTQALVAPMQVSVSE